MPRGGDPFALDVLTHLACTQDRPQHPTRGAFSGLRRQGHILPGLRLPALWLERNDGPVRQLGASKRYARAAHFRLRTEVLVELPEDREGLVDHAKALPRKLKARSGARARHFDLLQVAVQVHLHLRRSLQGSIGLT